MHRIPQPLLLPVSCSLGEHCTKTARLCMCKSKATAVTALAGTVAMPMRRKRSDSRPARKAQQAFPIPFAVSGAALSLLARTAISELHCLTFAGGSTRECMLRLLNEQRPAVRPVSPQESSHTYIWLKIITLVLDAGASTPPRCATHSHNGTTLHNANAGREGWYSQT